MRNVQEASALRRIEALVAPVDPGWATGRHACFRRRPDQRLVLVVSPKKLHPVEGEFCQEPGETTYLLTPAAVPISEAHVLEEHLDDTGTLLRRRLITETGYEDEETIILGSMN